MAYRNAREILPEALVAEIQKYCDGELIYIPSAPARKVAWGEKSGARIEYERRNDEIRRRYSQLKSFEELADMFCLSVDSIRKIVRT
ncbi:MAG: CD3324 family protein [Eubacteriales bacterium]